MAAHRGDLPCIVTTAKVCRLLKSFIDLNPYFHKKNQVASANVKKKMFLTYAWCTFLRFVSAFGFC